MLKIEQKITRYISRAQNKKTVAAKYTYNMTKAQLSALATGVQFCRFQSWNPVVDIPVFSMFGAIFIKSFNNALALLKDLRIIKQRAVSIKKAARNK